jgi:hypothetical protein
VRPSCRACLQDSAGHRARQKSTVTHLGSAKGVHGRHERWRATKQIGDFHGFLHFRFGRSHRASPVSCCNFTNEVAKIWLLLPKLRFCGPSGTEFRMGSFTQLLQQFYNTFTVPL